MANKNLTMHMIAGLDIGNGYVKGSTSVNGSEKTTIDFMSGVAVQTHSHDIKTKEEDAESLIKDIFNEMECSFDTPMITNNFHRLFGRRGVSSGRSVNEFDVSSTMSKISGISSVSLMYLLICSLLSPDSSATLSLEVILSDFCTTGAEVKSFLSPCHT